MDVLDIVDDDNMAVVGEQIRDRLFESENERLERFEGSTYHSADSHGLEEGYEAEERSVSLMASHAVKLVERRDLDDSTVLTG